jgi:hypothetical protein
VSGLGLEWDEATALMGVHTLGRASLENSPFDGPWSELPEQMRWNNNYYYSIIGKGWIPAEAKKEEGAEEGAGARHFYWLRSDLGGSSRRNINSTHQGGREMMLDTDMCLFWSLTNRHHRNTEDTRLGDVGALDAGVEVQRAERRAQLQIPNDREKNVCCLWAGTDETDFPRSIRRSVIRNHMDNNTHCNSIKVQGRISHSTMFNKCCQQILPDVLGTTGAPFSSGSNDCTSVLWTSRGSTHPQRLPPGMDPVTVHEFAADEDAWLRKFRSTWGKIRNKNKIFCADNLC